MHNLQPAYEFFRSAGSYRKYKIMFSILQINIFVARKIVL